jgi:hypothetical protein
MILIETKKTIVDFKGNHDEQETEICVKEHFHQRTIGNSRMAQPKK